eukprot:1074121-Rhodomonas_salina.1
MNIISMIPLPLGERDWSKSHGGGECSVIKCESKDHDDTSTEARVRETRARGCKCESDSEAR